MRRGLHPVCRETPSVEAPARVWSRDGEPIDLHARCRAGKIGKCLADKGSPNISDCPEETGGRRVPMVYCVWAQ